MAAIAPDTAESAAPRWLGSFVETWEPGTGAPVEDREPATGRLIATVRGSTPDDVARAAEAAAAAQPAWAATSYQERARVLRRAAEIYDANRAEFGEWTQRETGASHSKMHHESNFAYQEILNAATLPSQAYGSLVPTAVKGRLSIVRRVPVGVVGAITPWNSPSVLGMRVVAPALALGNAVVLKPDPQTPVVGGAMFAAVFKEAGLPDGLAPGRRRWRGCRRGPGDRPGHPGRLVHRVDGGRATRRPARRRDAQEGLARARRQQRVHRPRRRRPRRPPPAAGAFSAFQFQGQVCFAAGRHLVHSRLAEAYIATLADKAEAPAHRRPVPRGRPARPDRQREAAGRASPTSSIARSRAARRSLEGGTHEGLFYRPTVLTDITTDVAGLDRRDLRPRRADHGLRQRRRGGRAGQLQPSTASSPSIYTRSLGRGLAMADRMRTGMVHINDGTLNDEAIVPFGGMGDVGQRQPLRRRGQPRHVHRVAVGHDARRAAELPVLMASITEVAKLAGVSAATASRVVSASDYPVSAATRERVLEAARTLDYVPNALARGLLKSRVPVVAVIVHDITDPYFAEIVRGVEDAASVAGFLVITCSSERDAERERSYVRLLRSIRAAAVVFAGQRARRPGRQRGDRPSPRGDAGRWRGDRPPLAARPRRARGRRRQRGRDRGDGRGSRRARPSPDRVPGRAAVAVRGPGAAGRLPAAASTRPGSRTTSGSSCGRASTPTAARSGSRRFWPRACRSPRSAAPTTCSRSVRSGGWRSSGSLSRRPSRSPASTTSRPPALTAPSLSTVRLPLREMGRRGFEHATGVLAGGEPVREVLPTEVVLRDSTAAPARPVAAA